MYIQFMRIYLSLAIGYMKHGIIISHRRHCGSIKPNDQGHPRDGPSDGTARRENKLIELLVTHFGRLYTGLYLFCSSLLTCLRKLFPFPDIPVFVSNVQIESFSKNRKFLGVFVRVSHNWVITYPIVRHMIAIYLQ